MSIFRSLERRSTRLRNRTGSRAQTLDERHRRTEAANIRANNDRQPPRAGQSGSAQREVFRPIRGRSARQRSGRNRALE